MSANDQLPLFPEADPKPSSSDNRESPCLPPSKVAPSDGDDYSWIRALKDHFQSSTKLGKGFGVPADQILRWAKAGELHGFPVKKGKRDIRLFNRTGFAKFLMTQKAGKYQLRFETRPLSQLKVDLSIYARSKPTRQNCAPLLAAIRAGTKPAPLVAMRIEGQLILVDGFRREFCLRAVHGDADPLVEVFILPGNLAQAKVFAATCDADAGAGLAKGAPAYFKQLIKGSPMLKAQILANKLKSPTFATAFGLPRSSMNRCYRALGWVTNRPPKLGPKAQAKADKRKALKEGIDALKALSRASGEMEQAEAINHANQAIDRYMAFFSSNYRQDEEGPENGQTP